MTDFKPTILKDNQNNPLYPLTHAKGVFVGSNKTLEQDLNEIKASAGHVHSNKVVLDKLGESNGTLTFNGSALSGGGSTGASDPRLTYMEIQQEKTNNIFNKETIIKDGYYNASKWFKDIAYVSSDLIPVTVGKNYISPAAVMNTFWNNGQYVSYTRNGSFTIPTGVTHVRLAIPIASNNLDTFMFVEGTTLPSTYELYAPTPVYRLPEYTFEVELKNKTVENRHLSDETKTFIQTPTDSERLERARGKVNLFIETPYGGYNQPIHPSVLYFPSGWSGWKYWMAYTPYPYATDAEENPCIAVSNDMLYWTTPTGLTNPIRDLSDGVTEYHADTHLVYRSDLNRLECWFNRSTHLVDPSLAGHYRMVSTDGVNWSGFEKVRSSGVGTLSPATIWDEGKYKSWAFGANGGYFESVDGVTWTKVSELKYDTQGITITSWHGSVIKTDLGYEMVIQPETNNCKTIDYYVSDDGITWRDKKVINQIEDKSTSIDAAGFYRPDLLKVNGYYFLFTSTITKNGERGVTLSYSTKPNDILSLKGIDHSHIPFMAAPTKKPKGGYEGQVVFDKTLNKAIICTTGGRSAVWKDFNGATV
jgi:hypothetical protein